MTPLIPEGILNECISRDLRQVPDTQEVFLYPNSGTSIIVEVLERVAEDSADAAAR